MESDDNEELETQIKMLEEKKRLLEKKKLKKRVKELQNEVKNIDLSGPASEKSISNEQKLGKGGNRTYVKCIYYNIIQRKRR